MKNDEYMEEMSWNFFGEYWDKDAKKDTICFRVSKKVKDYFTNHANGAYGSTQKAMEVIFKKYMESIIYKRGKVNGIVVLLVPKFNSKEELEKIKDSELIEYDDDTFWHEQFLDKYTIRLEDKIIDDVVVNSYYVSNGITQVDRKFFNENLEIDGFDVNVDDYIVIPFYLNNHLDIFKNGVYRAIGGDDHSGLIITTYKDIELYIYFEFNYDRLLKKFSLLSNNEAYELAMKVDNVPLARIIASFNNDIDLFEQDIASLKYKRLQLEKDIMAIDEQLKKID